MRNHDHPACLKVLMVVAIGLTLPVSLSAESAPALSFPPGVSIKTATPAQIKEAVASAIKATPNQAKSIAVAATKSVGSSAKPVSVVTSGKQTTITWSVKKGDKVHAGQVMGYKTMGADKVPITASADGVVESLSGFTAPFSGDKEVAQISTLDPLVQAIVDAVVASVPPDQVSGIVAAMATSVPGLSQSIVSAASASAPSLKTAISQAINDAVAMSSQGGDQTPVNASALTSPGGGTGLLTPDNSSANSGASASPTPKTTRTSVSPSF